jgi:hypothetical protein
MENAEAGASPSRSSTLPALNDRSRIWSAITDSCAAETAFDKSPICCRRRWRIFSMMLSVGSRLLSPFMT